MSRLYQSACQKTLGKSPGNTTSRCSTEESFALCFQSLAAKGKDTSDPEILQERDLVAVHETWGTDGCFAMCRVTFARGFEGFSMVDCQAINEGRYLDIPKIRDQNSQSQQKPGFFHVFPGFRFILIPSMPQSSWPSQLNHPQALGLLVYFPFRYQLNPNPIPMIYPLVN